MQRFLLVLFAMSAFFQGLGTRAEAQLFGARSFGQPLNPQANPGGGSFGGPTPAPGIGSGGGPVAPSATSVATPDARFMRKNRNAGNFVGQDSVDARKIVGAVQVQPGLAGQPAALEVQERRIPESLINPQRTPPPRTRMYEPKLVVGFQHVPRQRAEVAASLQGQLRHLTQLDPTLQISTTVVGETVHLRGVVGSAEERELIEQMMLFEPGISAVQNDLTIPVAVPPRPGVD